MDARRLRVGDWLTGVAGLAALVSLWLNWFDASELVAVSGWEAFSVTDVLLALAAVCGIALVPVTAANDSPARPVAVGVLTLTLAGLALLLVAYRIVLNEPGPNALVGIEPGGYLGLLASLALFAAALGAVRDESSPHQAPIEPEQLPAPPREA